MQYAKFKCNRNPLHSESILHPFIIYDTCHIIRLASIMLTQNAFRNFLKFFTIMPKTSPIILNLCLKILATVHYAIPFISES